MNPSGERVEVEQLRCSLFQPAVFSVSSQASGRREHHLVVLERSWSLSRYSAQESSGPNHFRPCTSFPLRGHLLPLLLPPTRRPRCQGLHLHVHASSNVRISRLSKNWQPPPSRSSSMNSYRALMPPIAYLTYLDYALIVNLALCAVCLLTVIASAVPSLHIWGFW